MGMYGKLIGRIASIFVVAEVISYLAGFFHLGVSIVVFSVLALYMSTSSAKAKSTEARVAAHTTAIGAVNSNVSSITGAATALSGGTLGNWTEVLTGTNITSGVAFASSDIYGGINGGTSSGGNSGGSGAAALNGHTHGIGHVHSVGHTHYTQIASGMDTIIATVNAIYDAIKAMP